ncbi:MAG: DUF547 domain-containing protein [Bryobacteraceae bacterium]|nr:DUF547 domain-containing protein [Bryobacteraceae bacterium]
MAIRPLHVLLLTSMLLTSAHGASAVSHSAFDRLLKQYVSEQHRVDYSRWKQTDLPALDAYLSTLAKPWPASVSEQEQTAALINAYNALTIRWILGRYPVESIWKTPKPFTEKRHTLDAKATSLDDIETRLRNSKDPRVHALLVCAALSCPPLRREAYVPEKLEEQIADNTREWLANPDLNSFSPESRKAVISSIFKWYRKDFDLPPASLQSFLAQHGPSQAGFLSGPGKVSIEFREYRWGLNDTSPIGERYSGFRFKLDYIRNR